MGKSSINGPSIPWRTVSHNQRVNSSKFATKSIHHPHPIPRMAPCWRSTPLRTSAVPSPGHLSCDPRPNSPEEPNQMVEEMLGEWWVNGS